MDGFVQPQIVQELQIDVHVAVLVHLDPVDDPLELGVGHLAHIGDVLDLLEGLLEEAFQLIAGGQMAADHLQFIFEMVDLFLHSADLGVEFIAGDKVVGIHIHVALAGLLQLGELVPQLFLIFQVFIFGLIDPLKLMDDIVDDVLFVFNQPGKVCLQDIDQLILINLGGIGAVAAAASVSA